jgi:hypothetical protein
MAKVTFEISITDISGSGLSRAVTAQVKNTGSADAHNAWIKVDVSSLGQRISLSGQDSLKLNIGTVKARSSITAKASLSLYLGDGLRVRQNGAQLLLTVTSDEHTQTLPYNYKP